MSLNAIRKHYRGDWASRTSILIPGPNHSAKDRSAHLELDGDRVVIRSYSARTTWQDIKRQLVADGFITNDLYLTGTGPPSEPDRPVPGQEPAREKFAVAERIWEEASKRLTRTPVVAHAWRRGVGRTLPGPSVLRFHSGIPVNTYAWRGPRHPAAVVAIRDNDAQLTGVEITFLTHDGRRLPVATPRKTIGLRPPGASAHIDPARRRMVVAEGFWTALSATEFWRRAGRATLSASNFESWRAPPGVEHVLVAGDNNVTGWLRSYALVDRLRREGIGADPAFPPPVVDDWNTFAQLHRQDLP